MTSIAFLRLSNERMIGITDEKTVIGNDSGNASSKLFIKGNYVGLTAGRGDTTEEIIRYWSELPKGNFNEELENLTNLFHKIYASKLEGVIIKPHGLTLEEYKSGKLKSGDSVSVDLHRKLQNEAEEFAKGGPQTSPRFSTYLLFGGYNGKRNDMESYNIAGAGICNLNVDRFGVMGSGSEVINREFLGFFENMHPEKRDNVELADGLHVSYNALVKSEKAIGVGGVPSLAILEKDSVKRVDYSISRVMRNVVVKELKGEIERAKAKTYLENLATGSIDAKTVLKEISRLEDLEKYDFAY